MAGHECYHCKQWIEEGEAHDCWTTTEAALTGELSEDLREASAAASDRRRVRRAADLCLAQLDHVLAHVVLLLRAPEKELARGLPVPGPGAGDSQLARRSDRSSKSKFYDVIQIKHRDQVEAPITDWLRETSELLQATGREAWAA